MKVAFVVNASWNIYNFRMGIIRDFMSRGFEIYIIAPPDEFSPKLISEGCKFIPVTMDNKGSNPLQDLLLLKNLYHTFKKIRPDIILQFTIKPNIYGTLAARALNIPVINNISGLGTVFLHKNFTSRLAKILYKVTFRYPKRVFFQNEDDKAIFINSGFVKREITRVIPGSGVNLDKFSVLPFKQGKPLVFLLVARVLFDKGIVEYAEAIRILRREGINAKFQLIGSIDSGKLGVPLNTVLAWEKEGLMEYLGFQENILPFIHHADCIVLPSYREGTSKTLLEAAACGKPLIATDVPGCRELVINGQNGFLCMPKNPSDLAEKMRRVLACGPEKLMAMGGESRKLVEEKYDEKIVINEYIEALREILAIKIPFPINKSFKILTLFNI